MRGSEMTEAIGAAAKKISIKIPGDLLTTFARYLNVLYLASIPTGASSQAAARPLVVYSCGGGPRGYRGGRERV